MSKTWLQTYSGQRIELTDPNLESIVIIDIAHGLGNVCRFSGQCVRFYSVLEHSINVFRLVKLWEPENIQHQLDALMHDATEAYINDLINPVKLLCPDYKNLELKMEEIISKKFSLTFPLPEIVKKADLVILDFERKRLFNNPLNWDLPYDSTIELNAPNIWIDVFDEPDKKMLKILFLAIFNTLTTKDRVGTVLASP